MANHKGRAPSWTTVDSSRLAEIIDALADLHVELYLQCDPTVYNPEPSRSSVVRACTVIHSAVIELRDIVGEKEGFSDTRGIAESGPRRANPRSEPVSERRRRDRER